MTDPDSKAVLDLLSSADVTIANCEFSAFDTAAMDPIPQAESGGLWLNAGVDGLADLARLGIRMVSRANNHAADFGVGGMEETDRLLDVHQITHAGTGAHLGAARAPAYLTTSSGRVALISATCTFTPMSAAAYARPDMRGRPGVNAIRSRVVRVVDATTFTALQVLLGLANERGIYLGRATADSGTLRWLGQVVEKGSRGGQRYVLDERDVEANLAQVRTASRTADQVVFALHSHLPNNDADEIPDSIRDLTHRIIDAGAHVVVGHGPHRFKAVEIHRGRPILHGLANFVCHAPKATRQPADAYESADLDPLQNTVDDLFAPGGKWATMVSDRSWWDSVIARVTFEDGEPRTVELHPVDLRQHSAGSDLGTPTLADAQMSARILRHIAALSEAAGTPMVIDGRIGRVDCHASASRVPAAHAADDVLTATASETSIV
jgi:poly-gamma-glutamate capsule biosynthesis protein CapA/YwtB (metallophosphatase superfamily)